MKGTSRQVVEIVEPQNEYIEKVVVFLRQDKGEVGIARGRQEAEAYAQSLVCWKKRLWPGSKALLWACLAGAGVLLAAALVLLL